MSNLTPRVGANVSAVRMTALGRGHDGKAYRDLPVRDVRVSEEQTAMFQIQLINRTKRRISILTTMTNVNLDFDPPSGLDSNRHSKRIPVSLRNPAAIGLIGWLLQDSAFDPLAYRRFDMTLDPNGLFGYPAAIFLPGYGGTPTITEPRGTMFVYPTLIMAHGDAGQSLGIITLIEGFGLHNSRIP